MSNNNDIRKIIRAGGEQEYDKELLADLISDSSFSSCEVSRDELWYEINGYLATGPWLVRMKTSFHNDILFDNMSEADKVRFMRVRIYRD